MTIPLVPEFTGPLPSRTGQTQQQFSDNVDQLFQDLPDVVDGWNDSIDAINLELPVIDEAASAAAAAAADAIATAADRVQTGLDAAATAADVILTNADAIATAADRVQTGLDAAATAADAIATAADAVQTGLDVIATNADASSTAADAIATAADAVQTGLDATATAADAVQTGLDASSSSASASAALASENAAAASYDDFDDRYLGEKASDPTVDNDGDALITGALYFNNVSDEMRVYNGTAWQVVAPVATSINLETQVTGVLPIANGGTGITSFGSGVATWLGTPSSANLLSAVTDETGTGALVFATSPTLVTPALGTPASGVVTNLTGTASININGTVGATTPSTGVFTAATVAGIDVANALTLGAVAAFTWDSSTVSPASSVSREVPPFVLSQLYDQIKGCVLNSDGTVNYYLKSTNWAEKDDGTASVLTGDDGNVMVEIPKFYFRTTFVGTVTTWEISPIQVSGFTLHPAFILDGVEVDNRYYSAYDACVYDDSASAYISGTNLENNSGSVDTAADKLSSVKDVYPMVGLTRNEFRLLAAVNGTGWRQLDFYLWCAVGMLYAVEYQTFYNQDELGNGNTNGSYLIPSADQNDSPHTIAGLRDDVGNGSTTSANGQGTFTRPGTVAMKYRGIENLFGNCWNWADAININVSATGNVHLANGNDRANYADNTATNHTLITSSLTTSSANIQALLPLGPYFLAAATGGTDAQYVTDRHFGSAISNVAALVGGDAADGGDAGVFALGATTASAVRSRTIGGRLAR